MSYRIALIPGDGIGREVVPEGVRALKALSGRFKFAMDFNEFPYSCEHYLQTGRMMPEDGLEQLRPFDAILLGAVGAPQVPDHVSLWGLLIPIRRSFDQYVNCGRCACSRASARRWPAARRRTSTSSSCGRTPRASTPRSAAGSSRARSGRSRSRSPSSPATGWTASCATPSTSPAAGRRSTSPRPPSRTASSTPCHSGTNASAPSPKNSRT